MITVWGVVPVPATAFRAQLLAKGLAPVDPENDDELLLTYPGPEVHPITRRRLTHTGEGERILTSHPVVSRADVMRHSLDTIRRHAAAPWDLPAVALRLRRFDADHVGNYFDPDPLFADPSHLASSKRFHAVFEPLRHAGYSDQQIRLYHALRSGSVPFRRVAPQSGGGTISISGSSSLGQRPLSHMEAIGVVGHPERRRGDVHGISDRDVHFFDQLYQPASPRHRPLFVDRLEMAFPPGSVVTEQDALRSATALRDSARALIAEGYDRHTPLAVGALPHVPLRFRRHHHTLADLARFRLPDEED